ncbi:hypothetical protein [Nonomuraea angiospora]
MAARRQRPALDWRLTSRGTVSSAVVGFLGIAAATKVGYSFGVEPYIAAVVTGAAAVGSIVRSMKEAATSPALIYRLLRVLGAGGWSTFATATEPTAKGVMMLGVATVAAAALAPAFERQGPKTSITDRRSVVVRSTARLAREWEDRIRVVARIVVTIEEVSYWKSKAGFDLYGVLPPGATRKQLESHAEALAEAARLPNGCGITVSRGDKRGYFKMGVATVNRLSQDVPWPGKLEMGSINDPKAVGEHRDSTPVLVSLREACALITGQRGSGKTTTLHGFTFAAGMNRDALVWHMDLNGGGMSQPWLRAWLEGITDRPAVDWAAGDLEEAVAMAEVLRDILLDRKTTYAHLKISADAGLMPVGAGPDHPRAIMLLVDEGAECLAPGQRDPLKVQLRELLEEIQRIGRDGAGNIIVSSLRATQDMIAANIKLQSTLRIGMLVMDEAELNYLFGWKFPYSLDDLYGRGTGFIQDLETPVRPWKAGNLKPSMIREAAIYMANHRPDLDAPGIAIGGEVYATRHERMRARFTPGAELVPLPDSFLERHGIQAASAGGSTATSSAPTGTPTVGPDGMPTRAHLTVVSGGAADILARFDLTPNKATPLRAEQVHPNDAPALPAGSTSTGAAVPDMIARILELYQQAGRDRLHSSYLAAQLGMSQHVLAALLRPLGVLPLSGKVSVDGKEARGYERAAFDRAAAAIVAGAVVVPPEVARWRAS